MADPHEIIPDTIHFREAERLERLKPDDACVCLVPAEGLEPPTP